MIVPPASTRMVTRRQRAPAPPVSAGPLADRWPARAAATLAFASAAVTLFWTLGGTLLLDTVGGAPEDLARQRTPGSFAFGTMVVLVKVTAGLLALALLGHSTGWLRRRWLLIANGTAAAILLLWGGAIVLLGGLVLGGAITPDSAVDERNLRWHVSLWDLWFVVWGALIVVAVMRYRGRRS